MMMMEHLQLLKDFSRLQPNLNPSPSGDGGLVILEVGYLAHAFALICGRDVDQMQVPNENGRESLKIMPLLLGYDMLPALY